MSHQLGICFLPTNTNNTEYVCLLCDYTSKIESGYVGYCNHVKYKHLKNRHISSMEEYFEKCASKFVYTEHIGICLKCGKDTEFRSIAAGYKNYCSHKCSITNIDVSIKRQLQTEKALFEKYGVINASQIKGVPQKVKATKKERYGDETYTNPKKNQKTCLEKYGVTSYTQTEEYNQKIKKTSLKKYGVEHHTQSEKVKNKNKQTCLSRYGTEHAIQSPEIRKRIKETIIRNGGWSFQRKDHMNKVKIAIRAKLEKRIIDNGISFENVEVISIKEGLFKCKVCDEKFKQEGISLSRGSVHRYPRCLKCYPIGKQNKCSLFHQEFLGFLISELNFKLEDISQNNTAVLSVINKEIDLFIPSKKIAFELNGNIWHTEKFGKKDKNYHFNKTIECEKQGIVLVQIFEDEWKRKTKIVKDRIARIVGSNNFIKLDSLQCNIRLVDKIESIEFFNENHLEGFDENSNIFIGAYHNNQLFSCMSINEIEIDEKYLISRFAIKLGYQIEDIETELFNNFLWISRPKFITIKVDKRWNSDIDEKLLSKLKFIFLTTELPCYWCVHPIDGYITREKMLIDWEKLETEEFDRIWDCGKNNFQWKSNNII